MANLTNRKQHITVKFGIILGIEITLLFMLLGFIVVTYVSKSIERMIIKDTHSLLASESNVFRFHNSRFMQEMRMYTFSDVARDEKSTVEDIASWLVEHRAIRGKEYNYVMFCDKVTGVAYVDDGRVFDCSNTEYFKAMTDGTRTQYISNPVGSGINDGEFFLCKATNETAPGFFVVSISVKVVKSDCDAIKLEDGAFAFILDEFGNVISHKDDSFILAKNFTDADPSGVKGLKNIALKMVAGETGQEWIDTPEGKNLLFYRPVAGVNWSIALSIPFEQIYSTSRVLQFTLQIVTLIIAVVLIASVLFSLILALRPLRDIEKGIKNIATGNADLTQRLPETTNDEVGSVTISFNSFMERMQSIISDVKSSKLELIDSGRSLNSCIQDSTSNINDIVDSISDISGKIARQFESVEKTSSVIDEITGNIDSLERVVAHQAKGVESASGSIQKMLDSISDVNDQVENMAKSFYGLAQSAEEGIQKQKDMNDIISHIEEESKTLTQANSVIATIASQTKLLSMNAAIEAAHAGSAGDGFRVVAEEIRKLSDTSAYQSKTIREQLKIISNSISQVVSASQSSSQTFANLSTSIQSTDKIVNNIKVSMDAQMADGGAVDEALKVMKNNNEEVKSASAEMQVGNRMVIAEISSLKDVTDGIKVTMETMSHGAENIGRTGHNLSEISSKMDESMERIGNQIDAFKV